MNNPPMLTRDEFNKAIRKAGCAFVWVDLCPAVQTRVRVSIAEAMSIAGDGFRFGSIWGQVRENGELELGLTCQWRMRLEEAKAG